MSEQEITDLYKRLGEAMQHSLVAMLERKSKLGESVVIADSNGNPLIISANEALRILKDTPQAGQS